MNDFEEFNVTPELTLDPFQEEKKETPQIYQETEPETPEIVLTPEEKNMVSAFAEKIDLANSNMILQYGAGTQKKIADFSEKALENVKTKDLGEVGILLSDVVTELKGFDEEEEKGFLGIFKKGGNKIQTMKAKYAKAETNVNNIVKALESHEVQLMKDIALLDKMYEVNLTYYKELAMYVLAGKQKLAETRNGELQELKNKAMASGLAEDAQAAKDLDSRCERFEKKLHDLELTKTIAMQTAPQIRLVQGNDTMMAEKIQSTLVNTIPLWKSQMVLALGVEHSAQAAAAQREVNDMTNELLRKNAEKLKIATVETAKESERGIVDIETLKATNHKNKETRNAEKPTCQKEGYTGDIYCKDCGILLSSGKVTKKYDHDWDRGTVTKEATCKEEGSVTYRCENCDETETVSIKKTAHNYKIMEQKDATCTENGYSISACQTCNDKKKEEIVAKGHSKGIRNKKTATCKAEEYTGDTYCRICKTLLEEGKILPKLEHQWNDGTVTKRATYQTAGELTYRCRKCAAKRIISIEKLAYPKAGTSYTISGNEYKISKPGAEVILVKTSKTTKNVTVPAQIYAQGITYKVTSIGAKAFNNNKKLTKVTIGTNIVKINSNAFFNCKNLKTVTIKSVRLTKKAANKKAFKNAHKKLVIRVPKKVKKIYKKIFKGLKVK